MWGCWSHSETGCGHAGLVDHVGRHVRACGGSQKHELCGHNHESSHEGAPGVVGFRYGNSVVIHFEDMTYENLANVTTNYRGTFPCFSDDTQVRIPGPLAIWR